MTSTLTTDPGTNDCKKFVFELFLEKVYINQIQIIGEKVLFRKK